MEEQLVTKETAMLALECGFDEPCIDIVGISGIVERIYGVLGMPCEGYTNSELKVNTCITVPTHGLLARWLREIAKLDVLLVPDIFGYVLTITNRDTILRVNVKGTNLFQHYEEGMEEGLKQALTEYIRLKQLVTPHRKKGETL